MLSTKCLLLSITLFLTYKVFCDKSENWPPKKLIERYNVEQIQADCDAETNVDRKLVDEFEKTRDMDNLPDTQQLRCYFYCLLKAVGFMRANTTEIYPEAVMSAIEGLEPHEISRFIKMNRKCTSKLKEPCDKAYALNKCWKLNAPEYYYLY